MDNIAVMTNRIKDARQRLEFIVNGTQVEAHIVGAAPYDTILNIEAPSNPTVELQEPETSSVPVILEGTKPEECGRIRVKINYTHPFTGQQMTVHRILRKADYKDDRLIRIGNPEQPTDSKLITHMNHNHMTQNKKLYKRYKNEVNSQKISAEEKALLLKEAYIMMSAEEISGTNSEGYIQLNPPVIADGYLLDCELIFIQRTNHTCFQEWMEEKG